jgi:hypothetical protein
MVPMGIDRSELASRVRGLFKGLNRSEVTRLDREGFARAIGVDPLNIPAEYKRELARILYNEFKLPYRKICELLAMSARDVASLSTFSTGLYSEGRKTFSSLITYHA